MSPLFALFIFLLPIVVAIKLCEWHVIAAFIVAIIAVPFAVFFMIGIFDLCIENKTVDWKGVFAVASMFALVGIPIYFIVVMPIYYALKLFHLPLLFGFPISIAIISFVTAIIIARDPLDYRVVLSVVACGLGHSLLILWLIAKFRAIKFFKADKL